MLGFEEKIRQVKWLKPLQSRINSVLSSNHVLDVDHDRSTWVIDANPRDRYAADVGIQCTDTAEDGSVTTELLITTRHLNNHGVIHGGVLFTMAETAITQSGRRLGVSSSTLDMSVSFLSPAGTGDRLSARAEMLVVRRRMVVYTVKIVNQHQDLIAICQATVLRMA